MKPCLCLFFSLFVLAGNRLSQFQFNPQSPGTLGFDQPVSLQFHYETDHPAGVRIFVQAEGGCGAHDGSPVYPMGSGEGSTYFLKTGSACYEVLVQKVNLYMVAADTGLTLTEVDLPVSYTFRNQGDAPDLVLQNATISANQATFGQTLEIAAELFNSGGFPVEDPAVRLYRSVDLSYDSYNYNEGYFPIQGSLSSGQGKSVKAAFTAPNEPGTYFYFLEVDPVQGEPNLDNNRTAMFQVDVAASTLSYDYLVPHIPPTQNGWVIAGQIQNPSDQSLSLQIDVFEQNNGSFQKRYSQTWQMNPQQTVDLHPLLNGLVDQSWIGISTAGKPLGGEFEFAFVRQAGEGPEKTTLPLIRLTAQHYQLIFPHVPSDRNQFYSGYCLVNPNPSANTLSIHLMGENGSNLDHLLTQAYQNGLRLAPYEKKVSVFEEQVFDDKDSYEKVGWVQVTAQSPIGGFELFGRNAVVSNGELAGVLAEPPQGRLQGHAAPLALNGLEWTGFTLLNPTSQPAQYTLRFFNKDGSLLAQQTQMAPAGKKLVGLLTPSLLEFPYKSAQPWVSLTGADITNVGSFTVESTENIVVFELSGSVGEEFDGAKVSPPRKTWDLQLPTSTGTRNLWLLSAADQADSVSIEFLDAQGATTGSVSLTIGAHALEIQAIDPLMSGHIRVVSTAGALHAWATERDEAMGRTLTYHTSP